MSVSEFAEYQKRAERLKKLEALVIVVKEMIAAMRMNDPGLQHIALGRVYTALASLDDNKPTGAA